MIISLKAKHCLQIRNEKATEASHWVTYQRALVAAVHTTAQELIKLCRVGTSACLLDDKSEETTAMPLTNDAVSHQIKYFTANMNYKLISRLKDSTFAL